MKQFQGFYAILVEFLKVPRAKNGENLQIKKFVVEKAFVKIQ